MIYESYRNYKRAKRHFRTALDTEYENHMEGLDTVAECDITPILKTGRKAKKENQTHIFRNAQ